MLFILRSFVFKNASILRYKDKLNQFMKFQGSYVRLTLLKNIMANWHDWKNSLDAVSTTTDQCGRVMKLSVNNQLSYLGLKFRFLIKWIMHILRFCMQLILCHNQVKTFNNRDEKLAETHPKFSDIKQKQ